MDNLSDMSDVNESNVSVRENKDLSVDEISRKTIFSEEYDAIRETDDSEMNISISLDDEVSSCEAEIDTGLSLGNDKKMCTIDSKECNVEFNISGTREDHNTQGEMNVSEDDLEMRETDNSEMNTSIVNDISCSEAEVDTTLSLGNDPKVSTIDSEECDVQREDNDSQCEMNIPVSLENGFSSKTSEDSVLSVGNDQDSGVIEDDSNNKLDIIVEEDEVQSAGTSLENVDTSMSLPLGSEEDSGVIEDVPNDKLNLDMEEDIICDKDQTVDKAANNSDSLTPVENELDLIKDIIGDSSEDEAVLSRQTGAADESDPEEPFSPKEDELNEVRDTFERENKSRSSSKDLTLPYFKLPKPDLDEFLVETEKNLQISLPTSETILRKADSLSFKTKPRKSIVSTFLSKESSKFFFDPNKTFTTTDGPKEAFITIDLDFDYSKLSNKDASKKKVQIIDIDNETSCKIVENEYEKVVSSLNKDETDLPGGKRLALKEFLKKQIDQKRYEAFCHSKSLNKEDEEMEEEALIEEEEAANSEDEDSAEEEEEATVTFENLNRKDHIGSDGEDENVPENEPGDECVLNAEESDNESDDDFIGVRKAKKKFLVLDEDEDEDLPNENKSSLEIENTSPFKLKSTKGIGNDIESDDDINDVRDIRQCKNSQPAFREGDFQLHEKSNGLSQISSSMPSYQPGGGFNQEIVLEDSSDSAASLPSLNHLIGDGKEDSQDSFVQYQSAENILRKSPRNSVLESGTLLEKSILSPKNDMHHIKLDDLPISQTDNDSDIFTTNELADVCSGAFNGGDADELTEEVSVSQTNTKSGTTSLRRLEDVLKYPPKEKYEPEVEPESEPEEKITDFFDAEAELSGEDDGVDEKDEDSEDDNLVLHPSDEEDLPEDEVLREEIADLHMKRIMNDDAEYLREIQEQFLDDGELNTDGAGRSRRFAWINNDTDIAPAGNNSDSDSDADVADDTFSSINEEKAKWRQENKDDDNEDITEELNSSGYRRKSFLKVNIIGKPKFSQEEDKVKRLSGKRPRGSFLNLDDGSASQVLKKLKASEDNMGGSRTTKHFVFRNELTDPEASGKENSRKSVPSDSSAVSESPKMCSIFNKY